jgi:16S rRNA (cytosine1402-N4)-methyltransferase
MDLSEPGGAGDILNSWPEKDLIAVLRRYGEEPAAARIVRALAARRPIETTVGLADVVRECVPPNKVSKTLARVFQALRIAVNDELAALERALPRCVDLLGEGGRLVVISYHSLEDRRVKRFFRSGNFRGEVRRDIYGEKLSPLREITTRPIMPTEAEIEANPRARSARLRVAERHTTTARTE